MPDTSQSSEALFFKQRIPASFPFGWNLIHLYSLHNIIIVIYILLFIAIYLFSVYPIYMEIMLKAGETD